MNYTTFKVVIPIQKKYYLNVNIRTEVHIQKYTFEHKHVKYLPVKISIISVNR